MKILVNKTTYSGSKQFANNCLNIAREKYKKENVFALYGTQKDDILQMLNEVFENRAKLDEAVAALEKEGFTCYYFIRKGGKK